MARTGDAASAGDLLGLSIAEVAAAVARSDFTSAQAAVRWTDGSVPSAAAPLDPALLERLTWFAVDRLPPPDDATASVFQPLLSAIYGTGLEVAVHVGRDETGLASVSIGVVDTPELTAFASTIAAPTAALRAIPSPSGVSRHLSSGVGSDRDGIERLVARPATPSGRAASATSLLERLMAVTAPGWSVCLCFVPVHPGNLDRQIEVARRALQATVSHLSVSVERGEGTTIAAVDPKASLVSEWLESVIRHLEHCRVDGCWQASLQVAGSSAIQRGLVASTLSSGLPCGEGTAVDWISYRLPVAPGGSEVTSAFSTAGVAELLRAPMSSAGSLAVTDPPPADRLVLQQPIEVPLGRWMGSRDPVALDLDDLVGHGFVCGTTGSGKSSTVRRLAMTAWNRYKIPFLVVDPAKSDYEELVGVLDGGMRVVRGRDLRLAVLQPWRGADPATHLGRVATAFRGAFSLPSPVPYVLDRLFQRLLARVAAGDPTSLHDLEAELDGLIPELGYAGELEANIRASLSTRLSVLLDAQQAERVCAPDNAQVEQLLDRPALIQLGDLGDEEEASFLMAMILLYVADAARARGAVAALRHVTILEEAHRLVPEPGQRSADSLDADPGAVASRLVLQMLAEIRSYGESIIVVDQSPAAVARAVIRTTNLKVAHRVVDAADREVVAGSMGMKEEVGRSLGHLRPGEAIISSRRISHAQAVAVDLVTLTTRPPPDHVFDPPSARRCCGRSDDRAQDHHRAELAAPGAQATLLLELLARPHVAGRDAALERMQSAAPGTSLRCLVYLGLRRALWALAGDRYLDSVLVPDLLEEAYRAWEETGAFGAVPERVRALAATQPRPFAGCDACPCPCRMRPIVRRNALKISGQLDRALQRTPPGRERGVANDWASHLSPWVATLVAEPEAKALLWCTVLHVADAGGLGGSLME